MSNANNGLLIDSGRNLVERNVMNNNGSGGSGYGLIFNGWSNVYRGNLSRLGYDYVVQCVDTVTTDWKHLGPVPPPVGDAFIYLVSGRRGASEEGTLGFATAAERSNFTPCP